MNSPNSIPCAYIRDGCEKSAVYLVWYYSDTFEGSIEARSPCCKDHYSYCMNTIMRYDHLRIAKHEPIRLS